MPVPALDPLRDVARDHADVALGVAVLERAVEHPGDDLHVAVRVHAEAAAGRHDVVVEDAQQPVVGVPRVVELAEAEAVPRIEPVDPGVEPLRGRA